MRSQNVIIVGAGPAGMTAAIQLQRAGCSPILFERERAGGLLLNANLVENYPGFPDGIAGEDLVRAMVEQLERTGVRMTTGEVSSLRRDGDAFLLMADDETLRGRSVIVATGTKAVIPSDLPLPPSMIDRYIFTELRHAEPESEDRVAIVGGGDCAFDYALNLGSKGCSVFILHRGREPEAIPLLVERARARPSIEYIPGVVLKDIEEERGGITLRLEGGVKDDLSVDFLILAVGREPENGILSGKLREDLDRGVSIQGLHLAGDVRRGHMRQVGIAVGDGLVAAMDICRTLKGTG